MSHQPFETWILSEESLDKEQAVSLHDHLAECEPCRNLQTNWQEFHSTMTTCVDPKPMPGFTSRWHTRLAFDRQKRQQRRMWVLTLGIFTLASLTLISLMLFNLINTTWPYLVSQFIANLSVMFAKIGHFWQVLGALSNSFPIMIPLMVIISTIIISSASILILTWFSSMVRLFSPNYEGVTER
jgi:cation transport ATPase